MQQKELRVERGVPQEDDCRLVAAKPAARVRQHIRIAAHQAACVHELSGTSAMSVQTAYYGTPGQVYMRLVAVVRSSANTGRIGLARRT